MCLRRSLHVRASRDGTGARRRESGCRARTCWKASPPATQALAVWQAADMAALKIGRVASSSYPDTTTNCCTALPSPLRPSGPAPHNWALDQRPLDPRSGRPCRNTQMLLPDWPRGRPSSGRSPHGKAERPAGAAAAQADGDSEADGKGRLQGERWTRRVCLAWPVPLTQGGINNPRFSGESPLPQSERRPSAPTPPSGCQ